MDDDLRDEAALAKEHARRSRSGPSSSTSEPRRHENEPMSRPG